MRAEFSATDETIDTCCSVPFTHLFAGVILLDRQSRISESGVRSELCGVCEVFAQPLFCHLNNCKLHK